MRASGLAAWPAVALSILILLSTAGCAIVPQRSGAGPGQAQGAQPRPSAPLRAEIPGVPFFPQDDDLCGPAALATVLQAGGIERTPAQLEPQVYLPGRQGSLQVEMLGAARRAGAVPYVLQPSAQAVWQEVAAGHPVIVLQDLGTPLRPRWHYAVVVGFDRLEDRITLRSGTLRRLDMGLADFERSWSRGGRWAFVTLPPGKLPATASQANYLAALVDFERVSPALAPQGYARALQAWPRSLLARLALGNAAYRQGDLETAATHYRQVVQDDPEAADAWNNLALALHQQGHHDQALRAAHRALALGGARSVTYARTLAEITGLSPP